MKFLITFLIIFFCSQTVSAQKYLFYLHGRILEEQGTTAMSSEYGEYKYEAILDSFRKVNFRIISEVRKKNTDVKEYAKKIVTQIDSLINKGVKPADITVVGASKGSIIAMYVSTFLQNPKVNFVFMAGCFDDIAVSNPDINFYGNILSIHEKSDDIGMSCLTLKSKSTGVTHYKEIEINTGLKHGFLYQPLPEWMKPTIQWANGNYN